MTDAPVRAVIQGRVVDSKEEVFVATSLTKYGWEFFYQFPINGGNEISGGWIVDFLVYTVPLSTPLETMESWWHSGARHEADTLKRIFLATRLKEYMPLQEIWAKDLTDQEACDAEIYRMFGRR